MNTEKIAEAILKSLNYIDAHFRRCQPKNSKCTKCWMRKTSHTARGRYLERSPHPVKVFHSLAGWEPFTI